LQKVFDSSTRRATQIDRVDSLLYSSDSSVYKIIKFGLFWKYKQVVEADNETEYEICKECSQIHNELASKTYDDVSTNIDVIAELGKKKPLSLEVDLKS
jgi:hypothetical protein